VGDTLVYLFDNGRLVLISEEHSLEAEQKSMGLINTDTSTNPLLKHMLTRVLGLSESVDVFITPIRPDVGDTILMCSDGLTNYVSEQSIQAVLDDFSISLDRKVDVLIDEANRGGGGDNVSVILLEVLQKGRWAKFKKKLKL
jgi:protein phosphatase